jgi:hypothetical protein
MEAVEIKPIALKTVSVRVEGISRLVTHKMSERTKQALRDAHQGKKEKVKGKREPETEYEEAIYQLTNGRYGTSARSFKNAICGAAHKDTGIPRTVVQQSIYVYADGVDKDDGTELIAFETPGPKFHEGKVKVKNGSTDLRYRPAYDQWSAVLRIQYDSDWLRLDTLINLIEKAGWKQGINEDRPGQSGGDWGRFRVVRDEIVEVEEDA